MSETNRPGDETEQRRTAEDCPNCRDNEDCRHLLAGDDCPICGAELTKPPAGKVECRDCHFVVNGRQQGEVHDGFGLTKREMQRVLGVLGEPNNGSVGSLENRLRTYCIDHGVQPPEMRDVMLDLTGRGKYDEC